MAKIGDKPSDAEGWETLFEADICKTSRRYIKVRVMRKGEDMTFDIREFARPNAAGEGYAGPRKGRGVRWSLDLLPALMNALGAAMESQGL